MDQMDSYLLYQEPTSEGLANTSASKLDDWENNGCKIPSVTNTSHNFTENSDRSILFATIRGATKGPMEEPHVW